MDTYKKDGFEMSLLKKILVYSLSRQSLGKVFNLAAGSGASRFLIKPYIKFYKIAEDEIREPQEYESLTAFFVRDICPTLRPISPGPEDIVSPVDGTVADLGFAKGNQVILAKNNTYTISELLSGYQGNEFEDGYYLNIYLSPRNYHRIHMPYGAKTVYHRYVPGQVFPVNELGVSTIKDLFAKNRRTCSVFQTPGGVRFALIKVGALGVGKLVSTYSEGQQISKGEEIGRFEFGSTVILFFEKESFVPSQDMTPGMTIKMGQKIGTISSK